MSSSKILKLKNIFAANGGCGCRPKATDVVEPNPMSKTTSFSAKKPSVHYPSSSDSSWPESHGGGQSPQCCPEKHDHTAKCSKPVTPCPKIQDSFAIVKDSNDPYQDFRQSMLQMIMEKEIYSTDDLQQLLDSFLRLNSPHHQEVIVRAFMEICNAGITTTGGASAAAVSSSNFTYVST